MTDSLKKPDIFFFNEKRQKRGELLYFLLTLLLEEIRKTGENTRRKH